MIAERLKTFRGRILNEWFGQINSRPLSIFRIAIALVLIKTAVLYLPIAESLYSDSGVVPRDIVPSIAHHVGGFSLMSYLPQAWMVTLFFWLWIAVGICLLIGFQTRFMSVLNFILILSVHARNPYLVDGADDMLRLLSFWMMFVPLNHDYSV